MPTRKSPFRKGAVEVRGDATFVTIKPDEFVQIAPLVGIDEMVSADMHEFWEVNPFVSIPCFGTNDCPGCRAGNNPKFKAFLPVVTREGEQKVYSFGISVARQLEDYEAELGTIAGKVVKVKRTGSGFKTRYSLVLTGKEIDVSKFTVMDIIPLLGPDDEKKARQILVERGLLEEEVAEEKKSTASRRKAKAPVDELDDDDEFGDDESKPIF